MKKCITVLAYVLLLAACANTGSITNISDYQSYLTQSPGSNLKRIDDEIIFWKNRFDSPTQDIVSENKIASLLTQRFKYSGDVSELHAADSIYQLINQTNKFGSSATYRSLAANCITQHKFLQAQLYIDTALYASDDKWLSILMQFDIAMELGNTHLAKQSLNSLKDRNSFEYLTRDAKYQDHVSGDLESAIALMEKAWTLVKDGKNKEIKLWTMSNLADMYGHNNEFEKSYNYYLTVLSQDSEYFHALKGIAWLAFSKDKKTEEAKRILKYLRKVHPVPDYDLLLAEIADYEKDDIRKTQHLQSFISETRNVMYGDMYNKYLFILQADELDNSAEALRIAINESISRPTPEVYSWLAWAYMKNGEKEKALQTARYHVENKCFEPDALYYLGKTYAAAGQKEKAKKYLSEAMLSGYELGPMITKEIDYTLKNL